MIISHHRQVVSGKSVGLQDYEVVQRLVTPLHFATYQVIDLGDAFFGHGEPHDVRLLSAAQIRDLFQCQIPTLAVGTGRHPAVTLPLVVVLRRFLATITTVCGALRNQSVGQFVINIQPFRLEIWAVWSANFRAFVPVYIQPAEAIEHRLD